ncbi:MAG: TRAP transporter small permease subunit [Sphaerochaetaceae bacterium]|nr:TRAP transporter small permease subunit [Sphaerochaetaceae bacterium]
MGKFATLLAGLILIGVFGIILLGVSARFTGMRFAWTEELARWGLVSLTYVGASAALRNKQHAGVNIVLNLLPKKLGKIVAALAYLILAFVVVFLCMNSFEAAIKATRIRGDILPLSMMYVKLLIPASFFMMFFHLICGLLELMSSDQIDGRTVGL